MVDCYFPEETFFLSFQQDSIGITFNCIITLCFQLKQYC